MIAGAAAWLLRAVGSKAVMAVVGAALAGGLAIYVGWLNNRVDEEANRADRNMIARDKAIDAAAANFEAWERTRAEAARMVAALEAEEAKARGRASRVAELQRRISRAETKQTGCIPANDDPVAPVLDLALDGIGDGDAGGVRLEPAAGGSGHQGGD